MSGGCKPGIIFRMLAAATAGVEAEAYIGSHSLLS